MQSGASVGEATRLAYDALLRAIARKLGSLQSGLLTSDQKRLYEEAVREGTAKRDIIERLAAVLPNLAKPFIDVDLSVLLPDTVLATKRQLESAIKSNLEATGTSIYLFLDDTDQVAAPDDPAHLNRIWAFILATRALAEEVKELRALISLREEVWRRLTSDRAGQRDQTDHFMPLVRYLNPHRIHITRIIEKRLALAAVRTGRSIRGGNAYETFFEGNSPRMPLSNERSSWEDLIVIRSRERPRDAIQLINALAMRANKRKAERITDEDLALEMPEFSKQRVKMLKQEVESECPQMEDVVRALAQLPYDQGSFKASVEVVRDYLRKIPTMFSVTLFGRNLTPDDDDALRLWRFLWENGVLNARVSDTREKDGYRHVFPSEDPGLVSKARWNDLQAAIWEINPAYRDFLITTQKDYLARTGLPPTSRRSK